MPAILEHLRTERGARTVLCEGGPTLLRELVAAELRRRPAADGRADARRRRRADGAERRRARPAGGPGPARRPSRRRSPRPALHAVMRPAPARPHRRREPGRPLIMGIVNAGDDSFSDAGASTRSSAGWSAGSSSSPTAPTSIDVGGGVGRHLHPGGRGRRGDRARRPARRAPRRPRACVVSVDTCKPAVARAALAAGARCVNDVSGLRDPALAERRRAHRRRARASCTRAPSPSARRSPTTTTSSADVEAFLRERIDRRARPRRGAGAASSLDPGPDFAKTPAQTVAVLRDLDRLHALGRPLLLALSRKYFLGAITRPPAGERLAGHARRRGLGRRRGRRDPARPRRRGRRATCCRQAVLRRRAREVPPFDAGDEELKWIRADR